MQTLTTIIQPRYCFKDASIHPQVSMHLPVFSLCWQCRDVKPENIVLEGGKAGGRVYLVDFGGVQAAAMNQEFGSTIIGERREASSCTALPSTQYCSALLHLCSYEHAKTCECSAMVLIVQHTSLGKSQFTSRCLCQHAVHYCNLLQTNALSLPCQQPCTSVAMHQLSL